MEFVAAKQCRKRRKKRYLRKRLRERIRFEVRSTKNSRVSPEYLNAFNVREILRTSRMQADAFWKNYAVAQEWQKRHNVTWWRSRCIALEYENEVLRNKLRSLAQEENVVKEDDYTKADHESFEFNITEDILNFFETSERHRREMERKRTSAEEDVSEEVPVIDDTENVCVKSEQSDPLYDSANSKILEVETALEVASIDKKI